MVRVLAKNVPPPFTEGAPPGGFDFDPPRRAAARGAADTPASRPARAAESRPIPIVALSVRSRRPVKVALQLDEATAARGVFQVPPLTRVGAGKGQLRGVSIATGPGGKGVALNLEIPPRLAKGRYQGPVLDARTSRPVGFVSVDVGA
jgi:hypothetical protein